MAKITQEKLAQLQQKADQQNAKLQAAKARFAEIERKLDTRRKVIMGGLLLDAASKDKQWEKHFTILLSRIERENDKEPFKEWSIEQYRADRGKITRRQMASDDVSTTSESDKISGEEAATDQAL